MLNNTCCFICLSINRRTINIYETDLQWVYENLANFKVNEKLHFLCHICYRRLQQCNLLIEQVANYESAQINNSQPTKSIVHLVTQNIENESIPYHVVLAKEEPQGLDDQEKHFEHDIEVKRENESSEEGSCKLEEVNAGNSSKTKRTGKKRKKRPDIDETLCSICDKTFANKYSLATHRRTHTGEKPYACEICQKRFTLANTLNVHRRAHSGEKRFSCEKCERRFNTSGYLTKHMRTHTGDRPYACETCGKRFRQKNCLTTHRRLHSGEKPYRCGVCSRRFRDSSGMARHRRSRSDVRAYACDVCNKKFLRRYTLTEHKKIHETKHKKGGS